MLAWTNAPVGLLIFLPITATLAGYVLNHVTVTALDVCSPETLSRAGGVRGLEHEPPYSFTSDRRSTTAVANPKGNYIGRSRYLRQGCCLGHCLGSECQQRSPWARGAWEKILNDLSRNLNVGT